MRLPGYILFSVLIIDSCASPRRSASVTDSGPGQKFLIITADDYGASENINEGIELAAEKKVITSISVLANFGSSFDLLKQIQKENPRISVGVHLNITTGTPVLDAGSVPSLVDKNGNFHTIENILPIIRHISIEELESELRAQVTVLEEHGITPSFISDQHGILTLYSPFFDIMLKVARDFNLSLRSPVIAESAYPGLYHESEMKKYLVHLASRFAMKDPFAAIGLLKYLNAGEARNKVQKMDTLGILHPDCLIENFWGNPTPDNYLEILQSIQPGISEIIVHVGTYSRQASYPSGLDMTYFGNREKELITLTSDYLQQYYDHLGIVVIGYKDIGSALKK